MGGHDCVAPGEDWALSIRLAFLLIPWISDLYGDRPLENASHARVVSFIACPGMNSGLIVGVDMLEGYQAAAKSLKTPSKVFGNDI